MEVAVRVSARARRARIVVGFDGTIEVVVPRRAPRGTAERLVREHRGWIERQLSLRKPRLTLPRLTEAEGRRAARVRATALCAVDARRLGVTYGRIRIADQRTRWGSCSPAGTLSFNWRLVLAPPPVFEYVVVHELCHLRERGHGPRFWELVAAARPTWREERRWLREHGWELLAYAPLASGA